MEEPYNHPLTDENILDDVEYTFTQASSGKRFLNYIIDRVAVYLVWTYLLSKVDIWLLRLIYRYSESRQLLYVCNYLFAIGFFVFILAVLESVTGGKTLGKLLTGTRAINQDGSRITPRQAILRCLCRLVPFEPFSAFGAPCFPWHDRWSKTYVIDERLSSLPPERS
jgi:uncharacterized RDD family membrane protein YckC